MGRYRRRYRSLSSGYLQRATSIAKVITCRALLDLKRVLPLRCHIQALERIAKPDDIVGYLFVGSEEARWITDECDRGRWKIDAEQRELRASAAKQRTKFLLNARR